MRQEGEGICICSAHQHFHIGVIYNLNTGGEGLGSRLHQYSLEEWLMITHRINTHSGKAVVYDTKNDEHRNRRTSDQIM